MRELASLPYCISRFTSRRRPSRVVMVGDVGIGGNEPVRVQSMTTTNTQDVDATVRQTIALAEAGCEIVRITAPNKAAAEALGQIRRKVREAGFSVPLVADIHFLPQAAMEAVKHVEKVRINPGNYADKKKFQVREYSDQAYAEELERLHDAFSPIVLRCKELGKAMRIGTNHGSLSDRIMNRYGDSPLGMVESALEFIRIAEGHGYRDIILSMKASNPKVMIAAYRLAAARMMEEGMDYPLHLGVTEAGDGEDARVKSAIGIGALLYDGLGDTIRVSLTEDPIHEVPVARDLVAKATALWSREPATRTGAVKDSVDPFSYTRRPSAPITLSSRVTLGGEAAPAVLVRPATPLSDYNTLIREVCANQMRQPDSRLEGLVLPIQTPEDFSDVLQLQAALETVVDLFILELAPDIDIDHLEKVEWPAASPLRWAICQHLNAEDTFYLAELHRYCAQRNFLLVVQTDAESLDEHLGRVLADFPQNSYVLSVEGSSGDSHAVGHARRMIDVCRKHNLQPPFWIRNTIKNTISANDYYGDRVLESSIFSGPLLCDGIGDLISIEHEPLLAKANQLAYNILQGARARISKTEFVACPSCGRTLFDLQEVTQRIRSRTDHLKGVTIAIMGCIVNGPGEMADADFGYVGGAPGKINLYVGKECVQYNVPAAEALDRLIQLIQSHGKWIEPPHRSALEPEGSFA